ncbi:uncharacterized protein B0H64DRAFT_476359 [Chaetomium fimeti]|uniref:Uncharacterized protein n=1 Tax=Chaetomium fimeti TaxID=1854472 RepID=A0AAE0HEM6_9PEZI|nr:hypothetical protein B0H64DRAFT_476359 [Chaetomium fimeti]
MTSKAPSAGTKVTTGENIPVTREAPGNVPEGSLAAESARKGGEFASNPGQHEQAPQKRSQQPQTQSSQTSGGTADKATSLNLENQQTARGTGQGQGLGQGQEQHQATRGQGTGKTASETGGLESQSSYGGAAPTYLAGQRHRDPAGPHGKNLTEGGFEGSGTEAGPLPEPGSAEDPARAASRGMRAAAAAAPGQGRAGGVGAGAGGVEEGSWYTPLRGDEPA